MATKRLTNKEKTANLVNYLSFLLKKEHIEMRSTLDLYRQKLVFGDTLLKTEFENILNFLVRDVSYTKTELREGYKYLIKQPHEDTSNDLSAFLS